MDKDLVKRKLVELSDVLVGIKHMANESVHAHGNVSLLVCALKRWDVTMIDDERAAVDKALELVTWLKKYGEEHGSNQGGLIVPLSKTKYLGVGFYGDSPMHVYVSSMPIGDRKLHALFSTRIEV